MSEQEPKLCPYRKSVLLLREPRETVEFWDWEEFAPCLQDKCAMWHEVSVIDQERYTPGEVVPMDKIRYKKGGYCGLAGKP